MLASITPLGERSRNRRWWATYSWYVAGSLLGGALLGTALGALGLGIDTVLDPSGTAVAITAAVLGVVALLFELHVGGLVLPTVRRQVDEDWIPVYRAWVYAGGFGFQLGLGVVTVVTTTAVYLTWAFAVLTGSILGGLAIGLVFGAARAVPLLLVSHADTPAAIRAALRRFDGWARVARQVTVAATALVPAIALTLVWASS